MAKQSWFGSFAKQFTPPTPVAAADGVRKGVRTFLQVTIPFIVAAGAGWTDLGVWKSAAITGGAAVIALVQNAFGK